MLEIDPKLSFFMSGDLFGLPKGYVEDPQESLLISQKLHGAADEQALKSVILEIEGRFGTLPETCRQFFVPYLTLRLIAKQLMVRRIFYFDPSKRGFTLELHPRSLVSPDLMRDLLKDSRSAADKLSAMESLRTWFIPLSQTAPDLVLEEILKILQSLKNRLLASGVDLRLTGPDLPEFTCSQESAAFFTSFQNTEPFKDLCMSHDSPFSGWGSIREFEREGRCWYRLAKSGTHMIDLEIKSDGLIGEVRPVLPTESYREYKGLWSEKDSL